MIIDCLLTLGQKHQVSSVAFSPDGRQLASGSLNSSTLRLWDTATGQCIATLEGHMMRVNSVAFSPDGRQLASGSNDCTLRLWDTATGQCTATLKPRPGGRKAEGHTEAVRSVAFSSDGRQLSSGSWDSTLRLWDAATGQCTATLK
ncbi:WD repeat domain-containing protein, partial [Tetrabaena socialis]